MENNKNNILHGLPEEVIFCKKCIMSNQRPGSVVEFKNSGKEKKPTIGFNNDGICDACKYHDIKENDIDWKQREYELSELCKKFRSRNGSYDVVIPGSGGKDSIVVAHLLKYKYEMNPLTITWAPHMYTKIGWYNLQKWISAGFDNILITPNSKFHRYLTKISFLNLCHPFQPFIIGQRICGPKYATMHKIPLVMYGEHAAEYGDRIDEAFNSKMEDKYYVYEKNIDKLVLGGVSAYEIIRENNFKVSDLNPYLPVEPNLLKKVGVEVHHMSYFVKWDPQENYYYAADKVGFKSNSERTQGSYTKYNSIDDKLDTLHYYTTLIKFGIGRATYEASQEIRNEKITREEAVALVKKYDQEFPSKYFEEILSYLDINSETFWKVIDSNRSPHLWKKEKTGWRLLHKVF